MEFKPFAYFAANEYNCGAYGSGAYNESCATGTGDSSGASGGSGGLADTGMNMMFFLIIGIVLLLGSLAYLIRNVRKARQS